MRDVMYPTYASHRRYKAMLRSLFNRFFYKRHHDCLRHMINTPLRASQLTPAHYGALDFFIKHSPQSLLGAENVISLLIELGRTKELTDFLSGPHNMARLYTAQCLVRQNQIMPEQLAKLALDHYLTYRREVLPKGPVHPQANRWSWKSQEVDTVIALTLDFVQNYPGLAHDFAPMISEYEKALASLVQDWGMPSSGLPQLRAWLLRYRLMNKASNCPTGQALPAL